MKRKLVITMVVIASIVMTAGIVKAAGMTADWLRVGTQGEGGVTYFNGTIINVFTAAPLLEQVIVCRLLLMTTWR